MAREFFDGLSETLTRTAREFSGKAENLYEVQKIRSKMRAQEREKEKTLYRLGLLMYQRYAEGEALDEEVEALCEKAREHEKAALAYEEEAANVKGEKRCPSCGKPISATAAFCQHCGASCTKQEKEAEEKEAEIFEEGDLVRTEEEAFEPEEVNG